MAKIESVSPLAVAFPKIQNIAGVSLKTYAANWHYKNRDDLCAFVFDSPSAIAGVFTKNQASGVPVDWNRNSLKNKEAVKAIIINAGNANAFTGKAGMVMCKATAKEFASKLGCKQGEIWLSSTGVIGNKPDPDYVARFADDLLDSKDKSWEQAGKTIMTTDTFPKGACVEVKIAGELIRIAGIAKGSGMIAPDMATMLSFIVTDADLPHHLLQKALTEAVGVSFNCVTVDSDTSTSDMVLLAATGAVKHATISASSKAYRDFVAALKEVCITLAKAVAADGEGAKKFITVRVKGAASDTDAKKVALAIGNSPLVKTAIAGEDANWGRVVMAIGKSGAKTDRDSLSIDFGDIEVAKKGEAVPDYNEAKVSKYMQGQYIDININLHNGKGEAEIWSCDLTYDYIRINADYRS